MAATKIELSNRQFNLLKKQFYDKGVKEFRNKAIEELEKAKDVSIGKSLATLYGLAEAIEIIKNLKVK